MHRTHGCQRQQLVASSFCTGARHNLLTQSILRPSFSGIPFFLSLRKLQDQRTTWDKLWMASTIFRAAGVTFSSRERNELLEKTWTLSQKSGFTLDFTVIRWKPLRKTEIISQLWSTAVISVVNVLHCFLCGIGNFLEREEKAKQALKALETFIF